MCLPEDVSIGERPHSAAKDASLRRLWGLSPAVTSSAEALSTPTSGAARRTGLVVRASSVRCVRSPSTYAVCERICVSISRSVDYRAWTGSKGEPAETCKRELIGFNRG